VLVLLLTGCGSDDSTIPVEEPSPEVITTPEPTPEPTPRNETPEQELQTRPMTDEEIEAWALGCSAILATADSNRGSEPYKFGMFEKNDYNASIVKMMLSNSWGCNNRNELIATIEYMTDNGHNEGFVDDYSFITSLSEIDYETLMSQIDDSDKYMIPYIIELGEKWGNKELKAWDWFRMIHLAGWGYIAGFIERDEAYSLMEPIIARLRNTFSSWDEAVENYMDGYAWWSHTDISEEDTEYKYRMRCYERLYDDPVLFNPSVWTTEFVPSPTSGFTYRDNGDGTCIITGFFGEQSGDLLIPDEIDGLTVIAIGDGDEELFEMIFEFRAFTGFTGSLTLPESLETIEHFAFFGCNFSGILYIPENVIKIGRGAFTRCNDIIGIAFNGTVEHIGAFAFAYCVGLNQVDFYGDAPVYVGEEAFESIHGIFRITFDPTKSGWTTPEWNGYPSFSRG